MFLKALKYPPTSNDCWGTSSCRQTKRMAVDLELENGTLWFGLTKWKTLGGKYAGGDKADLLLLSHRCRFNRVIHNWDERMVRACLWLLQWFDWSHLRKYLASVQSWPFLKVFLKSYSLTLCIKWQPIGSAPQLLHQQYYAMWHFKHPCYVQAFWDHSGCQNSPTTLKAHGNLSDAVQCSFRANYL